MRPWLSWIERQTTNLDVGGSNPPGRAKKTIESASLNGTLSYFIVTVELAIGHLLLKDGNGLKIYISN